MDEISVEYFKNMSFEARVENFSIPLDAKSEHGGVGAGMTPKPLMLVALAGCTGMDVASLAKKMRVEIENLTIDAKATKTEQMPVTYTSVELTYNFTAADQDAPKIRKMVDMSQERYCGVAAMFRSICPLSYNIRLNNKLL